MSAALEALGLTTIDGVKSYQGSIIKNHKGSRDVLRLNVADSSGQNRTLYLKRTWKPYKKDGLYSLLQHGKVWSVSRRESENSATLNAAGLTTARVISYGEDCGPLWENFSYILTASATGSQTLAQFLQTCTDSQRRRRVLNALAAEIRKMHNAGLASPDLFTRHIFVDELPLKPAFCFIDMARLDQRRSLSSALRARDLAALNITAPMRYVSTRERLRFLKLYAGQDTATLLPIIQARMKHLLRRRKFKGFNQPPTGQSPTAEGIPSHRRVTTADQAERTELQP